MKLWGKIEVEGVDNTDYLIVSFKKDKRRQHFKIFMIEQTVSRRFRAGECYIFNIKFRSIVMPDVSGKPTYETELYQEGYTVPLPESKYWD